MSINGVNQNTDIQKLLKLMKANGAQKGAKAQQAKAPGMSMNDSIFSVNKDANTISSFTNSVKSRGVKNSNPQLSINTMKSVSSMSATQKKSGAEKTEATQGQKDDKQKVDIGNYDFDNLTQVSTSELQELKSELKELNNSDVPVFLKNGISKKLSKVDAEIDKRSSNFEEIKDEPKTEQKEKESKASESDSKAAATESKAATKQTEQGTQKMNESSAEMKSLDSKMKSDEKKMNKTMKKGQKEIRSNQKKMEKESARIQKEAKKMEAINAEIEQLSSKANEEGTSASEKQDIQGQIESKTAATNAIKVTIGKGNVKLKKLQSTSNRSTRVLARTAKRFSSVQNQNVKNIQANQQESNKVLDIANKADEIAGYTVTAGQITEWVGRGMQLYPPTAAAGRVVETVGTTVQTVGNYGKCAANLTKTAVYAAQGNIAGALTSAGAAVMSGASAIQGTKELQQTFKGAAKAAENGAKAGTEALKEGAKEGVKEGAGNAGKETVQDLTGKGLKEQLKASGESIAADMKKRMAEKFKDLPTALMSVGGTLQQAGAMIGQNNQNGSQPTQSTVRRTGPMHAQRRRLR